MHKQQVVIIGAGLTGLLAAYRLHQRGLSVKVLEARNRLGGRIHTLYPSPEAPLEMGATWLGQKHTALLNLLQELDIEIFEQKLGSTAVYEPISTSPPQLVSLPPNTDPSFRIKGGTAQVLQSLASKIPSNVIHLGETVQSIKTHKNGLTIKTNQATYEANIAVSTLPPFLMTETINFEPALPNALLDLTAKTHTWMGESIKVCLTYQSPFWISNKSSGTIFSTVGPIPEMYDHSNYEESFFALKGFLNGTYYSISKKERLTLIMAQLSKYFGKQVHDFISYEETVWRNESFTYRPHPEHVLPHQNNGNERYRQTFLEGKFFIAGSETAPQFPGYMDGAVQSAEWVTKQIKL